MDKQYIGNGVEENRQLLRRKLCTLNHTSACVAISLIRCGFETHFSACACDSIGKRSPLVCALVRSAAHIRTHTSDAPAVVAEMMTRLVAQRYTAVQLCRWMLHLCLVERAAPDRRKIWTNMLGLKISPPSASRDWVWKEYFNDGTSCACDLCTWGHDLNELIFVHTTHLTHGLCQR